MFFVGINIYFGSERFYEEMLMPALRYIDPERVHRLSIQAAKYGLAPRMKSIDDPVLVSRRSEVEEAIGTRTLFSAHHGLESSIQKSRRSRRWIR